VIGAGIIPAGMELMDTLAIKAAEDFCHPGYPLDAGAILIVEVDGFTADVDHDVARIEAIAMDCGATSLKTSRDEAERAAFWLGRKAAFPAVGRLAPDYYCMDGTIPLGKLPEVLARISAICQGHGLKVANIFHAGDGNLHPLILYDANDPSQVERAEMAGAEVLKLCVEVGGCLTGEHGVGIEKRDLMPVQFNETDLALQMRIKSVFDPHWLLNPAKVFPLDGRQTAEPAA
jgi:glycolate oxidase